MVHYSETDRQMTQIDEYCMKNRRVYFDIYTTQVKDKDALIIPIGNIDQLRTLLTRIEHNQTYSFKNLMDFAIKFSNEHENYLILFNHK